MHCYAYAHKAETLNNPYFLYRNNSQPVSHTGDSLKSIKSSLDGFEKYEKLSDNAFLKNFCGIWEIEMVFELVDQMISNKNTVAEITGVLDEYNLDLLINQYCYSNVNKEKYKLLNSNLSMYIKKIKKKNFKCTVLRKLNRIRAFRKIWNKVKYPLKIMELKLI